MNTVGACEAKTDFSQLLDKVANGESITITRHGEPVAQLVPGNTTSLNSTPPISSCPSAETRA